LFVVCFCAMMYIADTCGNLWSRLLSSDVICTVIQDTVHTTNRLRLNFYTLSVTFYISPCLNSKNSTFCPHSVYMGVFYVSHRTNGNICLTQHYLAGFVTQIDSFKIIMHPVVLNHKKGVKNNHRTQLYKVFIQLHGVIIRVNLRTY
jgi:hypothetical protein